MRRHEKAEPVCNLSRRQNIKREEERIITIIESLRCSYSVGTNNVSARDSHYLFHFNAHRNLRRKVRLREGK